MVVTVKPVPKQIQNSPQAPRKGRPYDNPAPFVCRPLPALPPSVAAQNARNLLPVKPKPILQNGAQFQQPRKPKRPAEPGRLTLIPLTTNGFTRELKCTVYRPSDFEAITVNGAAVTLGQGTFGEVNLMRLLSSKRPLVAVKFCKSHLVQDGDVWREVAAMQAVQDHWAFPKLYGIIRSQRSQDLSAIVMEFIGNTNSMMGMSVADAIRSKKYMPFKHNWVWIANDIARGLAHLHSKDYLHCDLKTNNALLWRGPNRNMWRAKLIDMGKACKKNEAKGPMFLSKAEQRETAQIFPHVPHEVLAGEVGYTVEGDIFSLGYLLLQIAQVSTLKKPMKKLGERCNGTRPRSRPALSRVIQELTSFAVNGC
ncbi:probable serine/threonine-protein kinase DDB_G0280461 [Patiria miniata]|uniref:Protein kinase domain-containing protein n=1 Tax=Patiria miniata TaxID=46514 RepID=A0A913ZBF6_PATMI|nr:probable serine/threonine-protein kinase DDB_G0280461 [Patiria miniata]